MTAIRLEDGTEASLIAADREAGRWWLLVADADGRLQNVLADDVRVAVVPPAISEAPAAIPPRRRRKAS